MKRLFCALWLAAPLAPVPVSGQPAIAPPQVGWVRDAGNALRPVTGLAANFILGDSVGDGVISSAFSGSFGIVKTDTALSIIDRDGQLVFRADAEAGSALFAFSDDGAPAFVYVPRSQTLLKWDTDHLDAASFNLDLLGGAVQSIASTRDGAAAIVKREDGLWLINLALGTQTLLPGVNGPVLLRNNGTLLYASSQELVLRRSDQSEQTIDGPVSVAAFELMGKDWVHFTERDSSRHFAVLLAPGREHVYQLPEAQP